MKKDKSNKILKYYAPIGKKECMNKCDRQVLMTENGAVIICNGCYRIVMDNRS